jgi:uncharacterized protein (UPF0332 family)
MDPSEFLKTAELLKTYTDQPHLRTSVGRSYYAALLYFRERLKVLGLEKTKQPSRDAHAFVIQCLNFSGVIECIKASKYLHDLQQLREEADYHLDKTFVNNDAHDAFAKAKKAIDDYAKNVTAQGETELTRQAANYAKQKNWI